MKKTGMLILLSMIACLSAFAVEFTNVFGSDIDFEFVPNDTIYKQYEADIWASDMSLHYLKMIKPGPTSLGVITEREGGKTYINDNPEESKREHTVYELIPFCKDGEERNNLYYHFVLADQFQIMRLSYRDIVSLEVAGSGGINTVFEASGGTDMVGWDGFFFIGGSLRFFDKYAIRIGEHHYSGHNSDEIMERILPTETGGKTLNYKDRMDLPDRTPGKIYALEHYVRQNSVLIGLSCDIKPNLRIYAEADVLPSEMHIVRPWVLAPNETLFDGASYLGETVEHHVGEDEGNYDDVDPKHVRNNPYPDSYKDRIIEFGAELSIPVGKIGSAYVAGNIKLYESGKTGYQIGAYSEDFGWARDIDLLVGFNLADSGLSVEASYHDGRFPLTHFFFHDCSYVSIGATYRH